MTEPIHPPSFDHVLQPPLPVYHQPSGESPRERQPSERRSARPTRGHTAIHLHQGLPVPLVRKRILDDSPGPSAECLGPIGVERQLQTGVRQRSLVPWRDEQAGRAMRDELRDSTHGGGDHWCSERHRFQESHRDALVQRGQDEDVHRSNQVIDIGPRTEEEARAIHSQVRG